MVRESKIHCDYSLFGLWDMKELFRELPYHGRKPTPGMEEYPLIMFYVLNNYLQFIRELLPMPCFSTS